MLDFTAKEELSEKAHQLEGVDQENLTRRLTIDQRKLDFDKRQKANTGIFGLASMELIHRTLMVLEENSNPEIQQIIRPLLQVSEVSQQAVGPLVKHSIKEAKDYRISSRQASCAGISEEALKKKLVGSSISTASLFEEESVSRVEQAVENPKSASCQNGF